MTGRQKSGSGAFPVQNNAPRTNEYFVPRDGIDREVITADICRYLGNDALVRPGVHTDDHGRAIQGYFITAYRNLTSAMIADLKRDSARWDAERRKHLSGAGTPDHSSDRLDSYVRMPNPLVRYQDSQIRDMPPRAGNGNGGGGGGMYGQAPPYANTGDAHMYDHSPHYQESDSPGYNASGPGGPAGGPNGPGGSGHYGGPTGGMGGYGSGQYAPGHPHSAPLAAQEPRFSGPTPPMPTMGGVYGGTGVSQGGPPISQEPYSSGAHYVVASTRDMYGTDMAMADAPAAPARRTSPSGMATFGNPSGRPGYGAHPGAPAAANYGTYGGPPPNGGNFMAQPIDGAYGRAPMSNPPGFDHAREMPPQPQQQQAQHGPPPGSRRDQTRGIGERPDLRDRDRDRDRDATPPNRTGSATKPSSMPHHHYGRR